MKAITGLGIGAIAVTLAAGTGYWLGNRVPTATGSGTVAGVASAPAPGASAATARKLLYYRNPMGLADTSPVPKKDPMGMDYIAVYEGEESTGAASDSLIRISTEKVQKLGVRTEAARTRKLDLTLRAAGRIEPDERRLYTIAPKFEGYVERLHVNATGQPVSKGQPLFDAYSPELVSAQREYAIAAQGVAALKDTPGPASTGMKQLAESSLQRLKNWDISEDQIKVLAASGDAKRTLSFRSPVSGVVTEKKAVQGMRFMPGEALYQVADLSSVWVIADIYEQDIARIRPGAAARVRVQAYPDKVFEGRVSYVYPTLKAETRTVPVRVELANPGLMLKPAMFAQVELTTPGQASVVTVPLSAVIDSGTRQVVLVQRGEGRFEPREVRLGARSDNDIEVLDGVKDGEPVVVSANFLIDAESNLKAALSGLGAATPPPGPSNAASGAAAGSAKGPGHRAEGTVESVDAQAGTVSLRHEPVPSLKWPAMTMEFKLANPALLQALKPGARVGFEFVERQAGEWVITQVAPVKPGAAPRSATSGASAHAGH